LQSRAKRKTMKKYAIYQVKEEKARDYGFCRLSNIIKWYGKVDKSNYDKVYESETECTLEGLFEKFNTSKPSDFKGRSLSISDVVILDGVAYYCDAFGWEKIDF
jgi:hypothetical protein